MIDKSTFDFHSFFEKYRLKYSEELVNKLIEAFNDPEKAYIFYKDNYIKGRCIELEPIIKKGYFDSYSFLIIRSIAVGWRCVDRTESNNIEDRIIDGAAWQILYALKEGKIPNESDIT